MKLSNKREEHDMRKIGQEPMVKGLNQLDVAILVARYSILLGMINYGTTEQKGTAMKIVKELESYIHNHINLFSFEMANRNLALSEQDVEFIDNALK